MKNIYLNKGFALSLTLIIFSVVLSFVLLVTNSIKSYQKRNNYIDYRYQLWISKKQIIEYLVLTDISKKEETIVNEYGQISYTSNETGDNKIVEVKIEIWNYPDVSFKLVYDIIKQKFIEIEY